MRQCPVPASSYKLARILNMTKMGNIPYYTEYHEYDEYDKYDKYEEYEKFPLKYASPPVLIFTPSVLI